MKKTARLSLGICATFASGMLTSVSAEPVTFSDQAGFFAALPGPATTLDFDGLPAGTTIGAESATGGIKFSYDFNGLSMKVTHLYATTSAPNFLGTGDAGMLHDGDNFRISFAPASAIGLFFITADPLVDGDITVAAGGATAVLKSADVQETLPDGSKVYFLGVIDAEKSMSQAEIEALPGGFFLYNVDDIVMVPADQSQFVATDQTEVG
jgi:hypothetical protein